MRVSLPTPVVSPEGLGMRFRTISPEVEREAVWAKVEEEKKIDENRLAQRTRPKSVSILSCLSIECLYGLNTKPPNEFNL